MSLFNLGTTFLGDRRTWTGSKGVFAGHHIAQLRRKYHQPYMSAVPRYSLGGWNRVRVTVRMTLLHTTSLHALSNGGVYDDCCP